MTVEFLLEFDDFHDHSHSTVGLFTKHLKKTDSPAAMETSRDSWMNSTVKQLKNDE